MKSLFVHSSLLHTMLRVHNLDKSLDFYTNLLGMRVLRRRDYPDGQFTLVFVGYGEEHEASVLELTYNWDESAYSIGTAYGHIAISVDDACAVCAALQSAGVVISRAPGPMKHDQSEVIAFIEDPDGYRIELIERSYS
jgi:lactoylglutathione lyase